MGAWAAARAAARGASCILLDQLEPGHDRGSSHGDGRIYRFAYEEDIYVDMMVLSLQHWVALQAFAGEELFCKTGGVCIADKAARGTSEDKLSPLEDLYRRRGLPFQCLTGGELKERYPQYDLPETQEALFQADMGVLFATKCVQATWRYAESLGAELRPSTPVDALARDGDGVVVRTSEGEDIRARSVVLAPGAWLSTLAEKLLGLRVPTQVTAETVSYYAPDPACGVDHSYRSMPLFISFMNNDLGAYGYYGLPSIDIPGVKVSAHFCGPPIDPSRRPKTAGGSGASESEEAAAAERIAAVIASNSRIIAAQHPHLAREPFLSQNCLYTCTADHDYVIDRVPGFPAVVLAGGGSGHAFKMGPAIGEACACLALGEAPPLALGDKFAVERLLRSGSAPPGSGSAPRK